MHRVCVCVCVCVCVWYMCRWICYPTLGWNIQGFLTMPNTDHDVSRISGDLDPLLSLARNKLRLCSATHRPDSFFCMKKVVLDRIKFFKGKILHVKSLWWQYAPMQESTKNGKSNDFLNNGTYWHIMIIPQTVRHKVNIKSLKIYDNFKNTARLIL